MQQGKSAKVAVNHEVVHLLSEKGNCVGVFENGLDYDECIYDKLMKMMISKVGCTVPWLPDKSKICDDDTKASLAFQIYQKNRRNQRDICSSPCHFTNMYFSPMVTGDYSYKNKTWGVFYFRRNIKTTFEYILYSLFSMAAEIGAYIGLFLGASFVNMGMVNSYLVDKFCKKGENVCSPALRKKAAPTPMVNVATIKYCN